MRKTQKRITFNQTSIVCQILSHKIISFILKTILGNRCCNLHLAAGGSERLGHLPKDTQLAETT